MRETTDAQLSKHVLTSVSGHFSMRLETGSFDRSYKNLNAQSSTSFSVPMQADTFLSHSVQEWRQKNLSRFLCEGLIPMLILKIVCKLFQNNRCSTRHFWFYTSINLVSYVKLSMIYRGGLDVQFGALCSDVSADDHCLGRHDASP